jgi:hypothetical protein
MRRTFTTLGLAAAAALFTPSNVFAGFTGVGKIGAGEHAQEQILENIYGGDFFKIGDDFFNGTVTVRRVDDGMTVTKPMSMTDGTIGDTTDEIWAGSTFTARAVAKFSDHSQSLSIADDNGTSSLFDAIGFGYNVTGAKTFDASNKNTWFVRSGDTGTHYSQTSMNADGRDHMLTYEVLGLAGVQDKVWVMFWEDLTKTASTNKRTHSDYNDLVVEMRATAIPLPAAAWAAIALGGGTFAFGKRIRKLVGA